MKLRDFPFAILYILVSVFNVHGATLYVNWNSANPTPPYTNWSTAATIIQDAIDAASDGDLVLVTNGVYSTGGKVMAGDLTNRVALDKAVTVQSVNGPWATSIYGAGVSNGISAVRCAWLTNGAALIGFTLEGGATRTSGDVISLQSGGGVWCISSNATVSNCAIKSNNAMWYGGGAYLGTLDNCLVTGNNSAIGSGGGCYAGMLNSCTIVSNSGSGIRVPTPQARLTNCIVYFNSPGNYSGSFLSTFSFCDTTPQQPPGPGNITSDPQFLDDGVHLTATSPCIGAGTNLVDGTDIDGQPWNNPPPIGCDEWNPMPVVIVPSEPQLTADPIGFKIHATIAGQEPFTFSWMRNGVPISDDGHYSFTRTPTLVATGISEFDAADYQLVASNSFGVITSAVSRVVAHFVNITNPNPVTPFLGWSTAATNIQDAINTSLPGEIVLVSEGVYATGGKAMDGDLTNRVALDKAILVQSINGPAATIIQGAWDPVSTNGPASVRCAWIADGATLSGFTLRGGSTRAATSSLPNELTSGGGVFAFYHRNFMFPPPPYATVTNAVVSNCLITGNSAFGQGGGASGLVLINCTVSTNIASGNQYSSSGGGVADCNLKNCIITRNVAAYDGGGAINSILETCAITMNWSENGGGGGVSVATVFNSTLSGNLAGNQNYAGSGGGASESTLTSCIIYSNQTSHQSSSSNYFGSTLNYCCAEPLSPGVGNIAVDPLLLDDGVHLSENSPCLGMGATNVTDRDIDDQPWMNPPSIGCDEWHPEPVIAQVNFSVISGSHNLKLSVSTAGQSPFFCFWSKDGAPIHENLHYSFSQTPDLSVNNFGPSDSGNYQVVVSNTFGVVTSEVAQVVIHAVDATSLNPTPPYSTWSTAATSIQDAIDSASAGEIVLVTNGIYNSGGKIMDGDLLNRVAVDKPLLVMSVNGFDKTIIEGAWDPVTTNGPLAVRCAWLADGARLVGFTLRNGATRSGYSLGGSTDSGGGVFCQFTNAIVSNCVLTNNSAFSGGGASYGVLNNCLLTFNRAVYGGGISYSTLNNCTIVNNFIMFPHFYSGAGIYSGEARNCIVLNNFDLSFFDSPDSMDNYSGMTYFSYTCTSPPAAGVENINADPEFVDYSTHISANSPCRGAGSPLYATGNDIDGEPWANPPSIGCDEVVETNLTGPLSVSIVVSATNSVANHGIDFRSKVIGKVSRLEWWFSDLPTTNYSSGVVRLWSIPGDYTAHLTAYNTDNPSGISASLTVHIFPLIQPELKPLGLLDDGFHFQFYGQSDVFYTVYYTTNLAPPITWTWLQVYYGTDSVMDIVDPAISDTTRFYKVTAQ